MDDQMDKDGSKQMDKQIKQQNIRDSPSFGPQDLITAGR